VVGEGEGGKEFKFQFKLFFERVWRSQQMSIYL